ncbi:predicted protein, partial [Nematostella vectensis]
MFTSQEYIDRKSGKDRLGRLEYLQALVTEFQDTHKQGLRQACFNGLFNFTDNKEQHQTVFQVSNSNDLPLDSITEENEKMVEFGIGGICNCCLDKQNKQFIIENGGIPLIINCLSSSTEETVLSALTSLMFLMTPATTKEILCPAVVDCLQEFADSSNKRLSNLAKVFLK